MTESPASPPTDSPLVLVAGEALIDVVHARDGSVVEHVGGSPANVAVGLATLGHRTVLATHLGTDERGERVRAHLDSRGVGLVPGSVQEGRTSTATARLDAQGAAGYHFDLVWELPPIDPDTVGHIHTGSIAATLEPGGSAVLSLLEAGRSSATCSYDPNLRPTVMGDPHQVRSRVEQCVGLSDVVKASEEDLHWLYAGAPLAEVAHLWGLLGPSLIVVTRGGQGALVLVTSRDEYVDVPGVATTVVDTVGAGDSFTSGLLSGLLDAGLLGGPQARDRIRAAGMLDVGPAVDRAVACATYTVERAGAAAPTRSDLG